MSVTPEQIEGAAFTTAKRGGYRTEEVDDFLKKVADEYRHMAARLRTAEGSNEDLQAASNEMASLMKDVHAQLGEKRRIAEIEIEEMKQAAEREAASIIAKAADQGDGIRAQADRVLSDAEHHAELLRNDGEQRVREQAKQTLSAARAELQELLRRKHEVQHALSSIRSDLTAMEEHLGESALSPDALDDSIINQTLVDLRAAQPGESVPSHAAQAAQPAPAAAAPPAPAPVPEAPVSAAPPAQAPPPPPPPADTNNGSHPAGTGTFFAPPDQSDN